jgi:hypothetical protein
LAKINTHCCFLTVFSAKLAHYQHIRLQCSATFEVQIVNITVMKKIILSLSALFAVSMASAQSYISQPDRTTYEVREYKAAKKAETQQAQPAQQQAAAQPAEAVSQAQDAPAQTAQPAAEPKKEVVENRKKK